MTLPIKSAFFGTVVCSWLLGCSAPAEDFEPEAESLTDPIFGETEPETLLQAYAGTHSVPIKNIGKTGGPGACTGTQIRRNVVVTALHCLNSNGNIVGSAVPPAQLLIGRPGLPSWFDLPATNADCVATTNCTTVKTYVTKSPSDLAILYLEPTEPRLGTLEDTLYVPLLAPLQADVGTNVEIAGYGNFNPFNPNDPANFDLNFGTMQVAAINTANTVGGNIGGVTQKYTGVANSQTQGGDSGAGVWTGRTKPPGLFAIHSGSEGCTWDSFCSNGQGPTPSEWTARFYNDESNAGSVYPIQAKDWEFNAAAEANDFEIVRLAATSSPGWQLSNGNFTPWNNVDTNLAVARTVMETGCVSTSVRTDDNAESGIVFRYLDSSNFYMFVAKDSSNYARIQRYTNGTRTTLASASWTGTWVAVTPMMVCFYGDRLQAWVNYGQASELNLATVEQGPYILGGRVGFWNEWNQAARHGHLRTMSTTDAQALVNTFLRL